MQRSGAASSMGEARAAMQRGSSRPPQGASGDRSPWFTQKPCWASLGRWGVVEAPSSSDVHRVWAEAGQRRKETDSRHTCPGQLWGHRTSQQMAPPCVCPRLVEGARGTGLETPQAPGQPPQSLPAWALSLHTQMSAPPPHPGPPGCVRTPRGPGKRASGGTRACPARGRLWTPGLLLGLPSLSPGRRVNGDRACHLQPHRKATGTAGSQAALVLVTLGHP